MKYIPSIAFEEMSGSAKGVTAAKMKSRKYIRNRGYGGSVRTADQAKVKGVFKRLTTMWKSLTPAQILAWNKLALSQEGRSVLGSKAKISGANLEQAGPLAGRPQRPGLQGQDQRRQPVHPSQLLDHRLRWPALRDSSRARRCGEPLQRHHRLPG